MLAYVGWGGLSLNWITKERVGGDGSHPRKGSWGGGGACLGLSFKYIYANFMAGISGSD
jgi:hypothetical protein